ncbi:MAG: hypothetical protein KC586_26805 [Myxococcales bacterium]|nr:hypothetical protein [Myxococcales bacterium]
MRSAVRVALFAVGASPALFVALVAGASVFGEASLARELDEAANELAPRDDDELQALARGRGVRVTRYAVDGTLLTRRDHAPRDRNALGLASFAEPVTLPEGDALSEAMRDEVRRNGVARWCETRANGSARRCASARLRPDGSILLVDRALVRGVGRYVDRPLPLITLVLVALFVGLGLSLWLARRLVRPLVALRDGVFARRRGETVALPRGGPTEIGEVADAFDGLLAHLAEERASKERLVADLAHALKTPLAAITTARELLEDAPSDERERLLANVAAATRRIDTTLGELLELSRVEAREEPIERFELDALVRAAVEAFDDERADRTIEITVDAAPTPLEGRARELTRAVRALLENAVSFAKARVEVQVSAKGERVTLEVRDDGPGFPTGLAVFERFVSTRAGGTGIGLALVAAVAQSHGGHARLGEGEGGHVVLTLARRAP